MSFIYGLKDPETLELKYIGKTSGTLKRRLGAHISATKRKNKKNILQAWIQSILNKNLKPLIEIIEECDDIKLNLREIYWISYYRNLNYNLKNINNGGDGNPKGYIFKGRFISPKGVYPEHFKKYKKANLGVKKTKQHCENLSKARKGVLSPKLYKKINSFNINTKIELCFKSIQDAAVYFNTTSNLIVSRCKNRTKLPLFGEYFKYIDKEYIFYKTTGPGYKRKVYLIKDTKILIFNSILECSHLLNISRDIIYLCCLKRKIKLGYKWGFDAT